MKRSLVLAMSMALINCSVKEKMDGMAQDTKDMKAQTKQMSNTTDKMSNTMDNMNGLTESLEDTTNWMFRELRQGDTLTKRTEQMDAMIKTPEFHSKLMHAGAYFASFEAQLMTQTDLQNEKLVDTLYYFAVREFLLESTRFIQKHPDNSLDTTQFPRIGDNEDLDNLYALASGMHNANEIQKAHGVEGLKTIYELVAQALTFHADYKRGLITMEEMPRYAQEVITHEKQARYLMQMRVAGLTQIVLDKIAGAKFIKENVADFSILEMGLTYNTWQPQLQNLNVSQLHLLQAELLPFILQTLDLMKTVGMKAEMAVTEIPAPLTFGAIDLTVDYRQIYQAMDPRFEPKNGTTMSQTEADFAQDIVAQLEQIKGYL